jgi:hypothetical protein
VTSASKKRTEYGPHRCGEPRRRARRGVAETGELHRQTGVRIQMLVLQRRNIQYTNA